MRKAKKRGPVNHLPKNEVKCIKEIEKRLED
jgi:hypothetical protein